jgi:hypothetical protein
VSPIKVLIPLCCFVAGVMFGSLITSADQTQAMEDCRRAYNVYACELKPSAPAQPVEEK